MVLKNTLTHLYPNAIAVTLNKELTITIELNSENINITQEHFEEDLYLDDGASRNAKRSLQFSSFFELENVEASSFVFSDGKYKEIEVKEFKEKDELDQSFYDDSKSLNFIYSNLKKGAKSSLKYSENVKNPRFLSPFYFADFSPIINNKITLVADKNIQLKFKEFHTKDLGITFNKEEKRNTVIYTWELKNTEEFKYESNAPTYKKILPHIIPIITSYKTKNETKILANEVADLYNWYYSLVKDINKNAPDEALIKVVNELTIDKATDFEKVKAIYYWTQKNIKYIAGESDFIIKKVPIVPAEKNAVIDNSVIELIGENLVGKSTVEISGYRKLECYDALEYIDTDEKLKTFFIRQLQKGNNRFIVDNFTETNKYDYDKNYIIDYNFNVNGYAKKLGDELYINLNLNKELSPYKIDEDRVNELEYDYKNHFSYTTTFQVPNGYKVDYIPENVSVSNNLLQSQITYSIQGNNIIYKHDVTLNFISLNLKQQQDTSGLLKTIEKGYKEVIVLKKI